MDYMGVGAELKKALMDYTESGGKGKPTFVQDKAVHKMIEKYEVVKDMFHGFDYKKVFIRNQKTRWGSCSVENNIYLNVKLLMLPEELTDYVILHELVHTRIKNHSKDFWRELSKYVRDTRGMEHQLKEYGLGFL